MGCRHLMRLDASGVALANVIELGARAWLDILICSNSACKRAKHSSRSGTANYTHHTIPALRESLPALLYAVTYTILSTRQSVLDPIPSHGHGLEVKRANHLEDFHLASPPTGQPTSHVRIHDTPNMSETSPLLDRSDAKPARPIPKAPRSVTFNPQVSTASPPSRNRPGFPSSASTSTNSIPNAQHQLRDGSQPMLSALNSKLRRRNSSGAPLQLPAAAAGVKIGPQRTSVRTQKLKLLPNPELGEDGPDEESGKDVYSQFTRIKDPTARRDAARLGKDDRDKLPRVTAYCTASIN